ncbi:MAG: hypothetical protein NZ580_07330 [Bacteroidia bacterium]|nr:hypothetical protein [Bacteroidia bacterium]MDW8236536.1 hypothetical protein [Bacteroidia bacterium]
MGSLRHAAYAALCTCFLVGEGQPLAYQPNYRSIALRALSRMYAMDFHGADLLFKALDSTFGPYAGTAYLRALSYSWRIEIDPATTWFDSFWERALYITDSLLDCCYTQPLEKYFIGFANRALEVRRLYVRGKLIASVWKARELLSLLEGIRKYAHLYPEMQLELGLYEYYIAYFYRNYAIMRPILAFFPEGNESQGLERLERCANDSLNYTRFEAMYFLGYIYLYQAKIPEKAEYWLRKLSTKFPENPLFRRMWCEALYVLGRYMEAREHALAWLNKYEESCHMPPCHLVYDRYPSAEAAQAYALVGMTYREEKNYAAAQSAFERMDTLLAKLPRLPAPVWARLTREAALLEKRMGKSEAASRRLKLLQERDDVPLYLKAPLPD